MNPFRHISIDSVSETVDKSTFPAPPIRLHAKTDVEVEDIIAAMSLIDLRLRFRRDVLEWHTSIATRDVMCRILDMSWHEALETFGEAAGRLAAKLGLPSPLITELLVWGAYRWLSLARLNYAITALEDTLYPERNDDVQRVTTAHAEVIAAAEALAESLRTVHPVGVPPADYAHVIRETVHSLLEDAILKAGLEDRLFPRGKRHVPADVKAAAVFKFRVEGVPIRQLAEELRAQRLIMTTSERYAIRTVQRWMREMERLLEIAPRQSVQK